MTKLATNRNRSDPLPARSGTRELARVFAKEYLANRNLFDEMSGRSGSNPNLSSRLLPKFADLVQQCSSVGVNPLQAIRQVLMRQMSLNRPAFPTVDQLTGLVNLNGIELNQLAYCQVVTEISVAINRSRSMVSEIRVLLGRAAQPQEMPALIAGSIQEPLVICALLGKQASPEQQEAALRRYLFCPDAYEENASGLVSEVMRKHPKF